MPDPDDDKKSKKYDKKNKKRINKEIKEAEKNYRTNDDFRSWMHQVFKKKNIIRTTSKNNPDLSPKQMRDAYLDWVKRGKPKVK